jgi:hypothetical protein
MLPLGCRSDISATKTQQNNSASVVSQTERKRAVWIHKQQAAAGTSYDILQPTSGIAGPKQTDAGTTLLARNPLQGLQAEFSVQGVRLQARGSSKAGWLKLARYGCATQLQEVKAAVPSAEGNRVQFTHSSNGGLQVEEWYLNGPLGLEQGFTLSQAPCTGAHDVVLELELAGDLVAKKANNNQEIQIVTNSSGPALHYGQLYAQDASGASLVSELRWLSGKRFQVRLHANQAVWPVVVDPLLWQEQAKLKLKGDTIKSQTGYTGSSFAFGLTDDSAWIGKTINSGLSSGYVQFYSNTDNLWNKGLVLSPETSSIDHKFGESVFVAGSTALVIAKKKVNPSGPTIVWAQFFVREGQTWTLQSEIEIGQDFFLKTTPLLAGDTAFVGANVPSKKGNVFVFRKEGSSWKLKSEILNPDGYNGDGFGTTLAFSNNVLLVGSPYSDFKGTDSGAVYSFEFDGNVWIKKVRLHSNDSSFKQLFGSSLAFQGNVALIGASGDGSIPDKPSGAVYGFANQSGQWQQTQKLIPIDDKGSEGFGTSLAIEGALAVVGSSGKSHEGEFVGSAYLYHYDGNQWGLQTELFPNLEDNTSSFGSTVQINKGIIYVGSSQYASEDKSIKDAVGYIYTLRKSIGEPCTEQSECAVACTDGVCCDRGCTDSCAVGCSVATGATKDGHCAVLKAGSAGDPACSVGLCNGVSDLCSEDCSSDSDCTADHYCNGVKKCVPSKSQGQACSTQEGLDCLLSDCRVCASGNCVDGYCCDSPCSGSCDVCAQDLGASANGTCSISLGNYSGNPSCGAYTCNNLIAECPGHCNSDKDCNPDSYCQADGQCTQRKPQGSSCQPQAGADCLQKDCRVCSTGFCTDGVCCNSGCQGPCESCNLSTSGSCTLSKAGSPAQPACGTGMECNGTSAACAGTCSNDAQCSSQGYCGPNGQCQVKKALGETCTADLECNAGSDGQTHCVDGVCCSSSCSEPCMACSASTKQSGANSGACGPAKVHSNPHDSCTAHDNSQPCGNTGYCTAFGTCALEPPTAGCGTMTCTESSVLNGLFCDGKGTCASVPSSQTCGLYQCDKDHCTNPCKGDSDCLEGFACQPSSGKCIPKASKGTLCDHSDDCASGYCIDGFCCETKCYDECQTCGEPGSEGSCKLRTGKIQSCGAEEECGGYCDGEHTTCQYPNLGKTCGTQCSGSSFSLQSCVVGGFCHSYGTQNCAPYQCSESFGCMTECNEDSNCIYTHVCNTKTKQCEPKPVSVCSSLSELTTHRGSEVTRVDCSPYHCSYVTNSCEAVCINSSDCSGNNRCDQGQCVPWQLDPSINFDSGFDPIGPCNCKLSSPASGSSSLWLAFLSGIAAFTIRRRKHSLQ